MPSAGSERIRQGTELRAESEIMDIHALQQIVHQTRDARRKQTIPKFSPVDRDQLIHKYHPDYRASAYRPIRFGPNADDKTVVELAALLEGDSSIPANIDLTPQYTTDVLVIGGGGAGCAAALHAPIITDSKTIIAEAQRVQTAPMPRPAFLKTNYRILSGDQNHHVGPGVDPRTA